MPVNASCQDRWGAQMDFLTVLKLEVHPGARAAFSGGLSPQLADGHLLVSSRGLFSGHTPGG